MKFEMRVFKKPLAVLLAIILAFPAGVFTSIVSYAGTVSKSISDAELVAANYSGLNDGEKNILKSGLTLGSVHTYHEPGEGDGLITVSAEQKQIKAVDYTSDGITWSPVSAKLVYSGGSENVTLTSGVGKFKYSGNVYTVSVDYSARISVASSLQKKLINGPYYLVKSLDNLEVIDSYESTFSTVGDYSGYLVQLTDGTAPGGVRISAQDAIDAILRISAQTKKNDGFLDIDIMLFDYEDAASKTEYLFANGEEFRSVAAATYNDIKIIYENEGINTLSSLLGDTSYGKRLRTALNALKRLLDGTGDAINDDWAILNSSNNPFKSGLSTSDYKKLDSLAAGASGASYHNDTVKTSLSLDTVSVTANVNQHNVNVTVRAEIIAPDAVDSTAMVSLADHTAVVQVRNGASASDVVAAVKACGIENTALSSWGEVNKNDFVRSVSDLPSSVDSDLNYVISYTPAEKTVTYGFETNLPTSLPYGYKLTLPSNPAEGKVYDYMIDGNPYMEGDVYKITKNVTISRTEGKPWDANRINTLVADSYADRLTDAEIDVLKSVALKSDTVMFRTPSNDDGLVAVAASSGNAIVSVRGGAEGGFTVDAYDYYSGISGLNWYAEKGRAISGSDVIAEFTFSSGRASFKSGSFDRIEVDYRLNLTNITNAQILGAINLPGVLAKQAENQKSNMDFLYSLYDQLGQLDRKTLNQIQVGVNGSDMSKKAKDAVADILNGCVDKEAAKLYLYEYLTQYHNLGLTYYYQNENYAKIRSQVDILNNNLSIVYNDDQFLPLLQDIGYESYYNRIGEIIGKLSKVSIISPNAAIDTDSPSLSDLVSKIERLIGSARSFASADKPVSLIETLTAGAPDRAVVTVTVQILNSSGDTTASGSSSLTYPISTPLSDKDIADINAAIESLINGLGVDKLHYTASGEMGLSAGSILNGNIRFSFTYSPNKYTVVIKDENNTKIGEKEFSYDLPSITLDACTLPGMQYRYTVCGNEITVGSESKTVIFTDEQIDSGAYAVIVRETIEVAREETLSLVKELNEAVAASGMTSEGGLTLAFIPLEDESGNISIVMRVSPKDLDKAKDAVQKIAESVIGSSFTYIGLGGELVREESTVSLQAFVDAILNSGMSLDTISEVIKADGDINEMTLPGTSAIGSEYIASIGRFIRVGGYVIPQVDVLGGKLFESVMTFGTTSDSADLTAKFYVTLEDFDESAETLRSLRELAVKLGSHGSVTLHDGMVDVSLDLPEELYQLYLTSMLVLGDMTFADFGNVDMLSAESSLKDLIYGIVSDPYITGKTIDNTAKTLGRVSSFANYNSYYRKLASFICEAIDNSEAFDRSASGNTYSSKIKYDLGALFDKLGLKESLRGIIKEASSGINAGFKFTVTNSADYQALVIDLKASKNTDKISYTRDLAASVGKAGNDVVVVLLSDIPNSLVFNKSAVLDLNGRSVKGDLICNASVRVIDSSIATESGAEVTGSVSGKADLTAGKYSGDVSAFVSDGYVINNRSVRNGYFYIETENDDIIIHVTPDTEILSSTTASFAETAATEIAADLLINFISAASLNINNNNIYSFNIDDAIGLISDPDVAKLGELLESFDCEGLTAIANDLLKSFTDLSAVGKAAKDGSVIVNDRLSYNRWKLDVSRIARDDILSVSVSPDLSSRVSRQVRVLIDDIDGFGDAMTALGKITSIDASVALSDISFFNRELTVTAGGNAEVTVDMASNLNYAMMMSVMIAYAAADTAKRDAIVNAIKYYYLTDSMTDLRTAVENATTADLMNGLTARKSFDEMVSSLGLSGIVSKGAYDLYGVYGGTFKVWVNFVERLMGFTGSSARIGTLITDQTGVYAIEKINHRIYDKFGVPAGLNVNLNTTVSRASIILKLFPDNDACRVKVTDSNGMELYKGNNINDAFAISENGSTIAVTNTVSMTADVNVDFGVEIIGADLIDFADYKIILRGENASVTSDKKISSNVAAENSDYRVSETASGGKYVYQLRLNRVVVRDASSKLLYAGDDLVRGLTVAVSGSTVTVNGYVTLASNVSVSSRIIISGAINIGAGLFKINLNSVNASITSDSRLDSYIASGRDEYYVNEEINGKSYTYSLKNYNVVVTSMSGKTEYAGNDPTKGFAAASNGSTIRIYGPTALTGNVALNTAVTVYGASDLSFGAYTVTLGSVGAAIKIDKAIKNSVRSYNGEYYINETAANGLYTYTLSRYNVVVMDGSGKMTFAGNDLAKALASAKDGSTVNVYARVSMSANLQLTFTLRIKGAANISWNGYKVILKNSSASLTSDVNLSSHAASGNDEYYVSETAGSGKYVYKLTQYKVVVRDSTGKIIYAGDNLSKALSSAKKNSVVKVNDKVSLGSGVKLSVPITIKGASKIAFGSNKITLVNNGASVTADVRILSAVESGNDEYFVSETSKLGTYSYKLDQYKIVVRDKSGKRVYAGDNLQKAVKSASAGGTVKVNSAVSLTADLKINASITFKGTSYISFGKFKIVISSGIAFSADKRLNGSVTSGDPSYYVSESVSGGVYTYKLARYQVTVKDKNGKLIYAGNDLNKAISTASTGSTINIYDHVSLTANVTLNKQITVNGSKNIRFGKYSITLGSASATLTTDSLITSFVRSGSKYSEVSVTGRYKYVLKPLVPSVNTPSVQEDSVVKGASIDIAKKQIILDILDQDSIKDFRLAGNGITAAQFKELASFDAKNASAVTYSIVQNGQKLSGDALIPTGAKVEITAVNPDYSHKVSVTYTVIILGDVNCNGRIDSGDAKQMLDHYLEKKVLKGDSLIAGDVNRNGRVESGDAVRNTVKYNRPADYRSMLK